MNEKIFVDTGAWYSLVDEDDEHHHKAVLFFKEAKLSFITSDYVLGETLTLIRTSISHKSAVGFLDILQESHWATVIDVSPRDKEYAIKLFKKYKDKDFSFIDCTSFALMERLGIKEAFSFDKHFRQIGFIVVP